MQLEHLIHQPQVFRWGTALGLASVFLISVVVESSTRAADPDQLPAVLVDRCVDCHNSEDANGGLDLTQPSTFFREADSGKIPIEVGAAEKSELFRRVGSTNEDEQMPPDGERLTEGEVERLRAWIEQELDLPEDWETAQSTPVESDHWAFQPISDPQLPDVRDQAWGESPIDRFIQHEREQKTLVPVSEAAPEALLRRATFALTGLPPTEQEVTEFTAAVAQSGDLSSEFDQLVDELLSQRSYGERWGRHWMDWVRYADTAGDNSDFPIPQAYLYRNYIIDALNKDVPYDRFIKEQLAGDLLPAKNLEERNRQLIATGYLAMARRFGSLIETYPWHLTIEDTIDNVGRTMLGLTLACARCHDHKFDPISTRDYYGLYGIFESTRYPMPGIELFQVQHDLVPLISADEVAEKWGSTQEKTEQLEADLLAALDVCRQRELLNASRQGSASVAEQRKRHDELQGLLHQARNKGNKLADHLKERPVIPVAYAVQDAEPRDAEVQIKGEPTRPGVKVSRKFPDVLGGFQLENPSQSGRLELANWIASPDNPLTARVIVNRVWQQHFGAGLVPSTTDFGIRGEMPSHPELLDWLARDFIRNGWSIKHLHRRIMGTRTYRLASLVEPAERKQYAHHQQTDPTNRFLWRFNRQRLDAESIRDALLAISGSLDSSPQTEPFPIPEQKKWEYTQHHPFKDDYPSSKRSVYQMTKRLTVESYMQTFDGPDPNVCTSKRDQSVTALQALYFVNDEFLHRRALEYADQLLRRFPLQSDFSAWRQAIVHSAFIEVLGRPPTSEETDALVSYLNAVHEKVVVPGESGAADAEKAETDGRSNIERAALASMARSLFRLNEFVYID